MAILNIIIGAMLLALGRKFFWFFVAATGFYAGLEVASHFLHGTPPWMAFLLGIVIGLAGALLAYFAQKFMIGLAGFLAGILIASRLLTFFAPQYLGNPWYWVIVLVAGMIGVALMLVIFEWALIILSSFAGSILIVNGLSLGSLIALAVGIVLFIIGLTVQNDIRLRESSRRGADN